MPSKDVLKAIGEDHPDDASLQSSLKIQKTPCQAGQVSH